MEWIREGFVDSRSGPSLCREARAPRRPRALAAAAAVLAALAPAPSLRADIVLTEIHYAPKDISDPSLPRDDLEFVEIFNDGPEAYDLSGYLFTRGISFIVPEGTIIDGRGYLVVCRNQAALRAAYGISNTIGDFRGVLDNAGETLELSNPQGVPVVTVRYNDRGKWPSGAKGTGHSVSLLYEYSDPADADNWVLSQQLGGTPGTSNFDTSASFVESILIADDEVWRYFKGTRSPPASWREVGFDDSSWLSGPTGIGYGDGDDRTELSDMRNGYLTVFCRKVFQVPDASLVENLVLRVIYDDGLYAYLNGSLVASENVTGTAFDAPAASAGDPQLGEYQISASLLRDGDNLLAVQVHNANLTSSDLSFIPELVSRRLLDPDAAETVPVVINEGHFLTAGTRFVELFNRGSEIVDLSGFHLTDDFNDLTRHPLGSGVQIPGGGFLVLTESDLGFDLSIVEGVRDRVSIALVNPAGERVVDARTFEPKVPEKSEARYPDGDREFAPAAQPTPGAANRVDVVRDVVFNEIHYHPISGREEDEFIELTNRGATAVDLGGWRVDGLSYEFPPGTVIGPGEYLVIARDPGRIRSIYGLDALVVLDPPWEGTLRDGGERLQLIDARGNVADSVRYHDGGDWSPWADGGGSSLERIDPHGASSAGTTWDASDDSGKAVTQTLSYTATHGGGESEFGMILMEEGIAIIDDIDVREATGGANLVANSTFDTSTSPWRIEGTHRRSGRTVDPEEVISGTGSLKLVCWGGGGDYKVNRIEVDTGGQVSGRSYRVTFTARWQIGSRAVLGFGYYNSANPSSPGIAGSRFLAVPQRLGTPGAVNSVTQRQIGRTGAANQGPAIDEVSNLPGVPEGGEAVTVRARVRDPDGVASVRLFYRLDRPSGSWTQRSMSDGDGDGVYSGSIPGQPLGTKVLFYIEATDGPGQLERYPRNIFERTHPPVVDPGNPSPNDALYCMYRHDTRFPPTSFHSYRFILDDESESELATRRVLSNQTLDGTFVFGGTDVYYNAEIRFAGSPWLRPGGGTWGKSYTIKMPRDRPLHGRKSAFNLDQHSRDGRERISHFLLRRNAGDTRLPYFDTQALVRFQLNDVRDATYEALDKPNRQYMDFWFPEDGSGPFYEMDDRFSFDDAGSRTWSNEGKVLYPPYGATSGGGNKENYRWYFALRGDKGGDDFAPLMNLCLLMDSRTTPDSMFDQLVFSQIDVEEFLRVWAIELNIDDWDTWAGRRGKNCYFYQFPVDRLWRLVPWDLELTYVDLGATPMPPSPAATYTNHFTEIQRMINRPRIKRMYYGILKEQVDGFFYTGSGSPLSRYAASLSGSSVDLGNTLSYINARAGSIRGWIRAAVSPQVPLEITTNNGNPIIVLGDEVRLAGRAPADVFNFVIVRNGVPLDVVPEVEFSMTDMTGWAIDHIPVLAGRNQIEVLGFNSRGDFVAQDSIEVDNQSNRPPPAITAVIPEAMAAGDEVTIEGNDFRTGLVVVFTGAVEASEVTFDEARDPTRITVVVPEGLPLGTGTVEILNRDGKRSDPFPVTIEPPGVRFIRGDTNLDTAVDLADAVRVLLHLFRGVVVGCEDALDADDSGQIQTTDAIVLLNYLFRGGPAPPAPFPRRGKDLTDTDALDCQEGV